MDLGTARDTLSTGDGNTRATLTSIVLGNWYFRCPEVEVPPPGRDQTYQTPDPGGLPSTRVDQKTLTSATTPSTGLRESATTHFTQESRQDVEWHR